MKSKGELDLKKAEEKNLNSQEGKDDLAQAKDLIAEAKKAELDHRLEDADALMIQAVELSDAAREGKGGTLKEKKETERVSWLRRIIKLVNRGAKKLKELTSSNDKASEPPSTSADNKNTVSFLQTIQIELRDKTLHLSASKVSDLGEKNINHLVNQENRHDSVKLRNTLRHLYKSSPFHRSIIDAHGKLIEGINTASKKRAKSMKSSIRNIFGG